MKKEYIGDGVYAQWEQGTADLILTTEVGNNVATNTIILEPDVLRALLDYIHRGAPNMG